MSGIREIVAGLAAAAESLAAELLPGGRREGREWVCPSAQSPWGCSVGVHLHPPRAGLWNAWAAGEKGDALDLVAQVRCQGDKGQALKWAKEWLRLPEQELASQPSRAAGGGNSGRPCRALGEEGGAVAAKIWLAAAPLSPGDPVDSYLLARGINLLRLASTPRALRFQPRLYHAASDRHWPGMVAAIAREGKIVGVHRTWLARGADGRWGKAPVATPKMTLGSYAGGVISLWRGADGKRLGAASEGSTALLGEGIEDALTAAVAAPEHRVLCALSLANLGAVELPAAITVVVILGQRDPWWSERQDRQPGRRHGTSVGLDKAIRRFQAQGRTVRLALPGAGKDINDLARGVT